MNHFRMAVLALVASVATGCDTAPTVVDVNGVAVDLTITVHDTDTGIPGNGAGPITLAVGETVSLGAIATNALGLAMGDVAVTWSSSNAAVADVSSEGGVTAVGEGTAEVQATAGELSATRSVVVTAPAP